MAYKYKDKKVTYDEAMRLSYLEFYGENSKEYKRCIEIQSKILTYPPSID